MDLLSGRIEGGCFKKCTKCNEWKSEESFRLVKDKRCLNPARRARCLVCEKEQSRIKAKAIREKDPLGVAKYKRENARKNKIKLRGEQYYIAKALEKENAIDCKMEKIQELNARKAFQYWMKEKASNNQVRLFYEYMGKPWLNPRLTKAEKYKIKWDNCNQFRSAERERQVIYKNAYPEVVARYQEKRRVLMADNADGSITSKAARLILSEFKACPYCGCTLNRGDKVIDHMDPISKGGAHSVKNVVVCCTKCNLSKGAKDFLEWVNTLDYEFKLLSVWAYINKRSGHEIKIQ